MAEQFNHAVLSDSLCLSYLSPLLTVRIGNAFSEGLVMCCYDGQLQSLAR